MAVTLVGEIVNQCDSATGFVAGGVDTDIFIEPTGSIGQKTSNTTSDYYTTSLGATAPYNYSAAGSEFNYGIIVWYNGLTPVTSQATGGFTTIVGNGTDRGGWYVGPPAGYTGGFIPIIVTTDQDFDVIDAGTWTLAGNPAQLTNVTQLGGGITTSTTIMGNFNNALVDQFTTGLGVRADAGTVGTPNTFETIRAADEDTSFWGFVTSAAGAVLCRGKIFIGPSTGTATSVFDDSAFTLIFPDEKVGSGFFEISIRGTNTDVDFNLASISSANPTNVRWSLTLEDNNATFIDTNSVFSGSDVISLNSNSSLNGTTLIDGTSIIQTGATINNCNILDSNTTSGVAYITSNNPTNIENCTFNYSAGHAIEITQGGTYTFAGNSFVGNFSGTTGTNLTPNSGDNDAMIYNNSGTGVTLNISGGGDTPSVRNGVGATTTVNNNVSVTIDNLKDNTEIRVYDSATSNPQTELAGIENATVGTTDDRSFTFSLGAGVTVDIVYQNKLYENIPARTNGFVIPSTDTTFTIVQLLDPNYNGSG